MERINGSTIRIDIKRSVPFGETGISDEKLHRRIRYERVKLHKSRSGCDSLQKHDEMEDQRSNTRRTVRRWRISQWIEISEDFSEESLWPQMPPTDVDQKTKDMQDEVRMGNGSDLDCKCESHVKDYGNTFTRE